MIKKEKSPNKLVSDLSVSFVSDLELRISDFISVYPATMTVLQWFCLTSTKESKR
jgi:hypothetical protein